MTPLRHSRNLLSGIQRLLLREAFSPSVVFYFYACCFSKGVMRGLAPFIVLDPGLKIAGVTNRG